MAREYGEYAAGDARQDPESLWLAQWTGLGDPKAWKVFHPSGKPYFVAHEDIAAWVDLMVVPPPEPEPEPEEGS